MRRPFDPPERMGRRLARRRRWGMVVRRLDPRKWITWHNVGRVMNRPLYWPVFFVICAGYLTVSFLWVLL